MLNCGSLMKSALVAVILVAVVECGTIQKLATCCTSVSKEEIKEPLKGFLVQEANFPCVNAVIFQAEKNLYCSAVNAPWVLKKIKELRKARAKLTTLPVAPPSPVSLLSIITSTSSAPSSSALLSSSSSPPSSSSSSTVLVGESFSESKDE